MNNTFSQTTHTSRINWKKLLTAAALCAFALAPAVVGSTPAMADRDDHRNNDYRNRDDNYRNHDNRNNDYRNRNDNNRNNNSRDARTYEGVVTNDQPGREFVMRLDSGQRVQVRSEEREPRRLSSGDRVRVQGYFNRTGDRNSSNTRYNDSVIFRATDVQIVRNNNGNNRYGNNGNRYDYRDGGGVFGNSSNSRSRTGVVTDVRGDRRVTVRIDGRDYDVQTAFKISDNVRRGTQVRVVSGETRGNNITGAVVVADKDYNGRNDSGRNDYNRNDNNRNSNGYYGNDNSKFEFTGRVTDVDQNGRSIRVRGDNGRDYSLRVDDRDELNGVRRGDRVRVRGQVRNGATTVDDVDKI